MHALLALRRRLWTRLGACLARHHDSALMGSGMCLVITLLPLPLQTGRTLLPPHTHTHTLILFQTYLIPPPPPNPCPRGPLGWLVPTEIQPGWHSPQGLRHALLAQPSMHV
mgnify:CR=1 FL=1